MKESNDSKVYEISYLLVPSLPAEKVGAEVSALMGVLAANSAEVIDQEAPSLTPLSYEMRKSLTGGKSQRFTDAYFGWIKFTCVPASIEAVKKAFDVNPNMLRNLVISTIREKTYLGKRTKAEGRMEDRTPRVAVAQPVAVPGEAVAAVMSDAQIAQVDKSIDDMVKGA